MDPSAAQKGARAALGALLGLGLCVGLLACSSGGGGGGASAPVSAAAAQGPPSAAPGPAVLEGVASAGPHGLHSPWPDDRFARADPTSPTGQRVAAPPPAPTDLGRLVAAQLGERDGFGVHAPITVTFDGPIDPATLTDHAVLVVNVDPTSARFGERVPLDLGRGSFPTGIAGPRAMYARDPHAATHDLVFPSGNPGSGYEAASRTAILRPLRPLAEGARHVAVITDGVRDAQNGAVAPPPGYVRSSAHDAALGPALAAVDRDLASIRYQWQWTTGTPTRELVAIARGLDGQGPLAHLAGAIPTSPGLDDLRAPLIDGSPFTLDFGFLGPLIDLVAQVARDAAPQDPASRDLANLLDFLDLTAVDYMASGAIRGPDLQSGPGGTFVVDPDRGVAQVAAQPTRLTYLVFVPKPCAENGFAQPPYPVLLFGHGAQRARIDVLGAASVATKHGWAIAAIDAVEHGPDPGLFGLPDEIARAAAQDARVDQTVRQVVGILGALLSAPVDPSAGIATQVRQALQQGILGPIFTDGRASDVDGDGRPDNGVLFFTGDVFRSRDNIRQTVIDFMVAARVFAGLGRDRDGDGRLSADEGDLDQDGVLDFGGPGARFGYLGISQGGIVGSVLAAVDPRVERATLMVPGGGLTDIVLTTNLGAIVRRSIDPMLRPVIVGQPAGPGLASVRVDGFAAAGTIATAAGGRVEAANLRSGGRAEVAVAADGGFVVHVAADVGDALELASFDAAGQPLGTVGFASPIAGLGRGRATPGFREVVGAAALALEPADPAVYAPLWRSPPAGMPRKDVLVQVSLADFTVPVFTGAALARAAGLVSEGRNALLIRQGVLVGSNASNVDRIFGVEAARGAGVRFLGVSSHAGALIPDPPNPLELRARYALAVQEQAYEFIDTGAIDDADPLFDIVLPR